MKYKTFLEAKTKLYYSKRSYSINHERPSMTVLRVICAAAGESKGGGSRLTNHVL